MLADDSAGHDTYVLGEINCSCVGFTSELDMGIQEKVAAIAISRVEEKERALVPGDRDGRSGQELLLSH